MVLSVKKVGVVGAGTMGHQIAEIMALNEYQVVLRDMSEELVMKGVMRIEKDLSDLAKFHETKAHREIKRIEETVGVKLTDEQKESLSHKLRPTYDSKQAAQVIKRVKPSMMWDDFADADLVIEAILEEPQAKRALFTDLDRVCPIQTIFASNTSSLSITEMASATTRREHFVGMHFFNPPITLPLVEVIPGLETSKETVSDVMNFLGTLKNHRSVLKPIRVKEVPGFLVNRILTAMWNEAFSCYEEGLASMRDIDIAMKLGAGFPMGPFELADFVGIDVLYHVDQSIREQQGGNTMPKPIHLIRQLYHAGRWGRKTGKGFFEY